MSKLSCVCLVLAVSMAQASQDAAKPQLPGSPLFKEPGARIQSATELIKPASRGRNLWLDSNPSGRRVILRGNICLVKGTLEEFLCLKRTKEHESIIAADVHPRTLHALLVLAGAEPGSVAKFQPEFQPPSGDTIDIFVEWKEGQETKRAKAQEWIRDARTQKSITEEFVFAGSQEIENPVTKQLYYLGNDGDLVSVANFASSVIDIAVESSNSDEEHLFEAFSERIPPIDTEVFVILKPVHRQKGQANPAPQPAKQAP